MTERSGSEVARMIDQDREAWVDRVVKAQYQAHPELWERFGPAGYQRAKDDVAYHLRSLAEAIAVDRPELFYLYVEWTQTVLDSRCVGVEYLIESLSLMAATVPRELSVAAAAVVADYLDTARRQLPASPPVVPSFIRPGAPLEELANRYLLALLECNEDRARDLILEAVNTGTNVRDIYLHVFQPIQHEIGRLWQVNQMTVAHEHYCTSITQSLMSQLYLRVFWSKRRGRRLVATCVASEMHELGIRMVCDFFQMEGWDTYYLGANTPASDLLQMLRERTAEVLALSATMSFHLSEVDRLIRIVRTSEDHRGIRILVGGRVFNQIPDLWRQIGADGYAPSAAEAISAVSLLNG